MTALTILGTLTAAEDRRLKGRLLPFGVPGHTNLGRVVVQPGGVPVPSALPGLHASLDHLDDRDDVATFVKIEERQDGLYAEWEVPKTHGGDRLLAEYRSGKRTGISVELEPVSITDGIATGTLIGCAFPVEPAFPTARLTASLAPDTESEDEETDEDDEDETSESETEQDPTDTEATEDSDDSEEHDVMTASATAPADLAASAAARSGKRLTAESLKKPADFFRLMAQAHARRDTRLLAALQDITATDLAEAEVAQWVGELWSGIGYQRRIVPLVNSGTLTSMKVRGWRWVEKPVMAAYGGDKAPVPSNDVEIEPVEIDAERLAGAHDIDRKFRDFGDTGFFESYYSAMAESYARLSDLALVQDLKAPALSVTPGAVPSGISTEWAALVDAALAVVDVGAPSFALVEKSVYRSLVLTPKDKAFEFLSASLGLEEGALSGFKIVPVSTTAVGNASSTGLDKGEILVGTRSAATFHELGGGAPIRAEAVDMVKGGIDAGCFGYYATNIHDPRGLARVDLTTDA